jgi:class 3 adenylate cyclase/tetratricopeptide (TPR) repeat protein
MAVCGGCGEVRPDDARYCTACGSPLAVESQLNAKARKTVTVVFADIAGLNELIDRVAPETARNLMARYFREMRRVLERHGGMVEKFIGDAVMAVFGVPVVHEDDAARAIRASVEMVDASTRLNAVCTRRWGITLGIRIGAATGEVLADDPLSRQAFVTGEAVHVAARLQQAAKPGEILIGHTTRTLAGDAVAAVEIAPLAVKGKHALVNAFRVLTITTRDRPVSPGAGSPFVGREPELRLLHEAFARCVDEPSCQLVTIIGEPGIGKSRLVREALTVIRAAARIIVGRCPPYGEGITYLPLRDIVRQLAPAGRDQLAALVKSHEADMVADRLAGAVGLSDASAPVEETNWAARQLLVSLARHQPLVVVLDDLHWAEPTFLDLVDYVATSAPGVPLLIICLARPELLEASPRWQAPPANAANVTLGPLDDWEARALVAQTRPDGDLEEEAAGRVLAAAEGNPLFLEQLLAIQAEDGAKVGLPPTIQAVLAARIDRLPPLERAVLQRAAVQGRFFSRRALREVVPIQDPAALDETIAALERRALLWSDPHALDGTDGVRFTHGLVRDTAYQLLPKAQRSQLHERQAAWLERTADQRLAELEEVIGYHLEQAYHYQVELGRVGAHQRVLGADAARRLVRSGRRALARNDLPAAVKLLERAAALPIHHDGQRADLLGSLGAALTEAGRLTEADQILQEAVGSARRLADQRLEAHALVGQLFLRIQLDPQPAVTEARVTGERMQQIFEDADDARGLCKLWRLRALIHWLEGNCTAADLAWSHAADQARETGDDRERNEILSWIASSAFVGPIPAGQAIHRCEVIRQQAREDRRSAAATMYPLAGLYAMTGRFDTARQLLDIGYRTLEDLGFITLCASFTQFDGFVETLAGDLQRAEERLRIGIHRLEEMGEKAFASSSAALLADVLHQQGRNHEAQQFVDRSQETAASEDLAAQIAWRTVQAKLLTTTGNLEAAEALARHAVFLAARTDWSNDHAGACLGLGEVLRHRERPHEAEAVTRTALSLYRGKGNVVAAEGVHALLAEFVPVGTPI